ncbi:alpha/beta fold hydrolase [Bradyrhizobium viridifuturi]|uniref:alpha/beta fold hydrolase n=1 Tax=Bradyrhizobium viridifuturi TaxID=1654716 RepID=UPI00067F1B8F|nr:alpha/beta hydrolase [Bradyrhizobium viridifuturi]
MTDITLDNRGVGLAASVDGPTDGEPLLFLHGLSLSRDTWQEIGGRLKDRYRVWTLDFRGHGHSDRAASYALAGYVSDAEAALAAIGRPAVIVGHSLGGCVAGVLAQGGDANVRAAFLEDPPWYLGQPGEWETSVFPKLFSIVSARQATWQQARAPLGTYLAFVADSPTPMGGIGGDHFNPRHLLSHASALQRQDGRCWAGGNVAGSVLAAIATGREFLCPVQIVQADPRCGAALLEGHEVRFARDNPRAGIVRYEGCGHSPHRAIAFEQRFAADLQAFLARLPSQ